MQRHLISWGGGIAFTLPRMPGSEYKQFDPCPPSTPVLPPGHPGLGLMGVLDRDPYAGEGEAERDPNWRVLMELADPQIALK